MHACMRVIAHVIGVFVYGNACVCFCMYMLKRKLAKVKIDIYHERRIIYDLNTYT